MGLFRRRPADQAVVDEPATLGFTTDEVHRAAVQAGVPGRCPECDGFGYIDHIDMIHRTQTQHCRECGHPWSFSFDEDGDVLDLRDGAAQDAAPRGTATEAL